MAAQLRPLNTVEILDASWRLLRRNGAQLYAASSIGTLPLALLVIAYFQWLGTVVQGTENSVFYGGTGLWGAGMALAWALNSVARGAVTAMTLADARGEVPSWGDAWRRAWKHAAGSAFVGLSSFSAGWLASTCLLAPGVFLALCWWVARPALMEEGRPFAAALRRSWRLTEGYRGRSLGLWLLLLLIGGVAVLNLHLLAKFLLENVAAFLGVDTTGFGQHLRFQNQAYTTFLFSLMFVLIDPLKTAADAVFYLDLRIRREGADLHERLRALKTGAAAGAALLFLLAAAPARATPVERYVNEVRAVRKQVQAVRSPDAVDPAAVGKLRNELVEMPGGQKLSVRNEWLREGLDNWKGEKDKQALVQRLEALERSLAGVEAGPGTAAPAPSGAETDPKGAIQAILQEPEFQPLADRPELRELAKNFDLKKTGGWWQTFVDWVRKMLYRPAQPRVQAPSWQPPDLRIPAYVVLGIAGVLLLAMLVRWFVERPARGVARPAAAAAEAPPLEASTTENALDHTVDEWEQFAQRWLGQGDARQAIRALYLATLVHLHRERRIEYNRAFTNWVYVRQFRGETEQKGTLTQLTKSFDEVWYGERPCGEDQYRTFERGVRDLGTPAPGAAGG
jgi:hypothetical protein